LTRIVDIERQTCAPEATLRDVMARFNELAHPFLVVVDAQGRPLGTLTDGDVRRAMLTGTSLDAPVVGAMNPRPLLGRLGEAARPSALPPSVGFVPMVDDAGVLHEIWLPRGQAEPILDALVMAGGFGKRLGERTRSMPKPLIEVGEKPLLEHTLEWLEAGGIARIHVATHYLAEQIEGYLERRVSRADIRAFREDRPLGTAGAVRFMAGLAMRPFVVVNADVLTRLDFGALAAFHHQHGCDGTLAVVPHVVEIPFGVVRQDDRGAFEAIEEKPRYSYFIASGIYLLSPAFCGLVPRDQAFDMPDLLAAGRKAGLRIGVFPIHEYWRDVGREDDLASARREIT
jgi:dTDP-glucose pyrophosphorylase